MRRALVTAALAGLLGTAAAAAAATIVVPDDRPTIQDAVAAAAAGDTIRVRPRAYAENVIVRGPGKAGLVLEAVEGHPVVVPAAGDGIRIERTRRVTVRGLAVMGGAVGVHVVGASDVTLTDVRVVGAGEGIRFERARDGDIRDCAVEGTARGPGIRLRDSPGVSVNRNVVTGSRRDGIAIMRSDAVSVEDNRVEQGGGDGIRLVRCDGVEDLDGNVTIGNRGSGLRLDRGFLAGVCPACGVTENTARDNGRYGVRVRRWARVSAPADLTERDNVAAGNRKGDFRVRP